MSLQKKSIISKGIIFDIYKNLFSIAKKNRNFSSLIFNEIKLITKKTKVRPKKEEKFYFCNKCGRYLSTVPKIKNKKIIMKCHYCGHINKRQLTRKNSN